MAEEVKIPAVVLELAKKANGTPLAWYIGETFVTIVFEDGRKLTYEELPAKTPPKQKKEPK